VATLNSEIWYNLAAKPIISYASNAIINKEGEEERINHWVNKKWRLGRAIYAPIMHQWRTNSNFCMRLDGKNR